MIEIVAFLFKEIKNTRDRNNVEQCYYSYRDFSSQTEYKNGSESEGNKERGDMQ